MTVHDELAQAAAEYCAAPESDERRGALIQCVLTLPMNDPGWKHVELTSGIISCDVSKVEPIDFNCNTADDLRKPLRSR